MDKIMKLYTFSFAYSYGGGMALIAANTKEEAIEIARKHNSAWSLTMEVGGATYEGPAGMIDSEIYTE